MFVILAYDVNIKRVAKVRKLCKKYLHPVQRSVFEGDLTGQKLNSLKDELERTINSKQDTICIYEMDSMRYTYKWQIGMVEKRSNIL